MHRGFDPDPLAVFEEALKPEPFTNTYAIDWFASFRKAVILESTQALSLVRDCGLEPPCARPTT